MESGPCESGHKYTTLPRIFLVRTEVKKAENLRTYVLPSAVYDFLFFRFSVPAWKFPRVRTSTPYQEIIFSRCVEKEEISIDTFFDLLPTLFVNVVLTGISRSPKACFCVFPLYLTFDLILFSPSEVGRK